ncbi:hypothetical protein [Pedobacter sp. UBA5917]|uniref:hypothetical protein n=1 Tax=Pedobacter sp. UBA5917 TaxID=1947061 RepID=UPI0025ED4D65|nr:hypothetical protein [Pedobacter sp. UBA5917]
MANLLNLVMNIFANTNDNNEPAEAETVFLKEYNEEIDRADNEIEAGNFISHKKVEHFFALRRKNVQSS